MTPQEYKTKQIALLPDQAGVYALCDLDDVPIYVGKARMTKDTSIRKRVQRHLTSARSDIIANRQIDVWEVAFVRAWPVADDDERTALERILIGHYHRISSLFNGTAHDAKSHAPVKVPEYAHVAVIPEELASIRRDPSMRFPRQVQQFHMLLDYILNTQDKPHLRLALRAHHERMTRFLTAFLDDENSRE